MFSIYNISFQSEDCARIAFSRSFEVFCDSNNKDLSVCAVAKRRHTNAMYDFQHAPQKSADGAVQDTRQVVDFCTRAIEEGCHVKAMFKLTKILNHKADGVGQDNPLSNGLLYPCCRRWWSCWSYVHFSAYI